MFESAAIALFLWVGNYAKFVDIVPLTREKGCANMVPLTIGDTSDTLIYLLKAKQTLRQPSPWGEGGTIVPDEGG